MDENRLYDVSDLRGAGTHRDRDVGEWKAYAMERFKGILDLTVKNSLKTRSPVPDWASGRIRDAWNVI